MIKGKFDPKALSKIRRDFKILTLTPAVKQKVLDGALVEIKKNLASNKNKQQTPEGEAWTPRKRPKFTVTKKGKKKPTKMLRKINKTLMKRANAKHGVLQYRNRTMARIAAEHQYGAELEHFRTKRPFTLPARPFLDEDPDRNMERVTKKLDELVFNKL